MHVGDKTSGHTNFDLCGTPRPYHSPYGGACETTRHIKQPRERMFAQRGSSRGLRRGRFTSKDQNRKAVRIWAAQVLGLINRRSRCIVGSCGQLVALPHCRSNGPSRLIDASLQYPHKTAVLCLITYGLPEELRRGLKSAFL